VARRVDAYRSSSDSLGGDALAADPGERLGRGRQCHRADDVRAPGLLPVRQIGPRDVIDGDRVHRAATAVVRDRCEAGPRTDERAAAERGVHLVRREDHVVEVSGIVMGAHVDRSVGRELGGVDQDATADRVHPFGEIVDRLHDTRDVRRPRHREEGHPPGVLPQAAVEVLVVEGSIRAGAHVNRAGPRSPWQVVGVVLEQGREHDRVLGDGHRPGQFVGRLGGVLGEDDDVAVGIGTDESGDSGAGVLVSAGAQAGLVARAAVDAGVVREKALDRLHHRDESRGTGRVVQVHIGHQPPVENGHARVDANEHRAQIQHGTNVRRCRDGR
jgi:hypothetical protein